MTNDKFIEEYGQDESGRPIITLPSSGVVYVKFIQVNILGQDYLRSASDKSRIKIYHGNLLEQILNEFNLVFKTFYDEDVGMIPEKENNGIYSLVGAGDISQKGTNKFEIEGESGSYPCYPNKDQLVKLLPYFPDGTKIDFFNGNSWEKIAK